MPKKDCELCDSPARMLCESDEASLCWDCDEKVHAANFLVAKHLRTLLCHACHSPTPWKASGLRLGQAFSICRGCADGAGENRVGEGSSGRKGDDGHDGGFSGPSESESDDGENDSDSEESNDGENQVVPRSASGSNTRSAALENYSIRREAVSLSSSKRTREIAIEYEVDDGCSSAKYLDVNSQFSDENSCSSPSLLRSLQMRGANNSGELLGSPEMAIGLPTPSSGTASMVEKLHKKKCLRRESEACARGCLAKPLGNSSSHPELR